VKARCVRIVDEKTGKPLDRSSWLTVGRIYHVLSVYFDERKTILIRMIADDGVVPALYALNQFEVVSPRIPSSWVIDWQADGVFEIAPAPWLSVGFWEKYFDGDKGSVLTFDEERRRSIGEDP
jgi:hypothetical protein